MPLPKRDVPALVDATLNRLSQRNVIAVDEDQVAVVADGADVLTYYANTIAHHFGVSDVEQSGADPGIDAKSATKTL